MHGKEIALDTQESRLINKNTSFQGCSGLAAAIAMENNFVGRNLKNAAIALLAPLPSVLFYLYFLHQYHYSSSSALSPLWTWCYQHPLILVNILFFLNIDILFWLLSLLQSSNWMIDLYWTVIPVMLVHYYATHPASQYDFWRSRVVMLLTWVWGIRLSHSYFRREKWQFGARQDWRFTDMGHQYGKNWWWISFFAVYLSQQVFLVGVSLPLYLVHSDSVQKPCNKWDLVALVLCVSGIAVAYFADTQLNKFQSENERKKELGNGKPKPCLDEGLWHYSRHPNYFGEQLWWWGLVIIGWNLGCSWSFAGALMNSVCLGYVSMLVESKMLKEDYRREAYRMYQKTTSVWIPWFKSSPGGGKHKTA